MCGICGYAGVTQANLLEKMSRSIAHRGPDDSGFLFNEKNKVALAQRRLSIIDLNTGKQPIYNETGRIAVVFNGEIYNYPELRASLIAKGHAFKTTSDTEVLVHLYEDHGEAFISQLNGIFAFVIYDFDKNILLGARDYFGVKPLYYYQKNHQLLFASEVKAILCADSVKRQANLEAMHYSLNMRFVPGELTLFQDIYRLKAGDYFVYKVDSGSFEIKRYWNKTYTVNSKMNEAEASEGIRFYLKQAVQRQLISDVPVGAYLSGGLDSSSVVAYASEFMPHLQTFSMGFDEPTDEVSDARKVAAHYQTRFYETFIKMNPLESMQEVLWHVEEPKVNMLQGYFLSKFAKEKVKVVLSGLGGDELFAGYINNQFLYPLEALHRIIPKNMFSWLGKLAFEVQNRSNLLSLEEYRRGIEMLASYGDKTKFYLILRNVWDYNDNYYSNIYSAALKPQMLKYRTKAIFEKYFSDTKRSIVEQSLNSEFNTKMVDDFLLNEDRTSMANGLEVRVPFLDRDLVEFAFSIPYQLKIKNNQTKYIYKKAMASVLPEFVINKKKWGFAINPYHQFKKDLKRVAQEVLNEQKIKSQGVFNYNYIKRIIDYPVNPSLRWHYYYLWQLIGFQHWYDMFIENFKIKGVSEYD